MSGSWVLLEVVMSNNVVYDYNDVNDNFVR